MRWELTNATNEHEIYQLMDGDKKLLTLELNSFSQAARVQCNNEKRVFVIRKEGFLRNRTVIRNEYGFKVGELGNDNQHNFITVDDEKFYYSHSGDPLAELLIRDNKQQLIATCGLSTKEGRVNVHMHGNKDDVTSAALLMATCWYLFLPVAREITSAYA